MDNWSNDNNTSYNYGGGVNENLFRITVSQNLVVLLMNLYLISQRVKLNIL